MKKCNNCGKYLEDSATYCSFCGARCDGLEEVKKDKKVSYVNYLAIFSLVISVVPTLFSSLLNSLLSLANSETYLNLINGNVGKIIGVIYLFTIILGVIISVISFFKGFKKGGITISIISFLISIVLLTVIIVNGFRNEDFLTYLKNAALGVNISEN